MGTPIRIVNCAELARPGWTFLKEKMADSEVDWSFHSATPKNWLERFVTRPKLARYRAALTAALDARRSDILISHLPRMTWWAAVFGRLFSVRAKHIAFSFNFTDLPVGLSRKVMSMAFQWVDVFVVYSTIEKSLYANYFGIDSHKLKVLPWVMETPSIEPLQPLIQGKYVCGVGGEGRDYLTLITACKDMRDVPLVVVARSHSVAGLAFPEHFKVLVDIPVAQYWNIVKFSRFVVIPLRDQETNCGHITMVGSMKLGKPLVTTVSRGTEEYSFHYENALLCSPGDSDELRNNISLLWRDRDLYDRMEKAAFTMGDKYDEGLWTNFLNAYIRSIRKKDAL